MLRACRRAGTDCLGLVIMRNNSNSTPNIKHLHVITAVAFGFHITRLSIHGVNYECLDSYENIQKRWAYPFCLHIIMNVLQRSAISQSAQCLGYGLNDRGSIADKTISFFTTSTPILGSIKPRIHWYQFLSSVV